MQAPRAHAAPGPERGPADDPEVPPWQAAYVTCPACHRPVRRERLATHMKILHSEEEEPEAGESVEAEPAPRGLRGLWRRVFGRQAAD